MKFLNEIDGAKRVKQDSNNRFMTDTEKTKLSGIATKATSNPNVTTNEVVLGGKFKIVYNAVTDSLDFEVI